MTGQRNDVFAVAAGHLLRALAIAAGITSAIACAPAAGSYTTGGPDEFVTKGHAYHVGFDDSPTGPVGGSLIAVLGEWVAQADATAPSPPNVLRQASPFGAAQVPRLVLKGYVFDDVTASVSCRTESGSTTRSCGLIFRLTDSDNYYLARANALDKSVTLFSVVAGKRQQLGTATVDYTTGAWHKLAAGAHGSTLTVSWDDRQVVSVLDGTYASGKLGLCTDADSITAFDDLYGKAE